MEGYVDRRNRPAMRGNHGSMLAASFVLVVEILENLAFLANASSLVLYLSKFMHYSPSSSANIVTNFTGTAFLLALLGGFLADAFFTTYGLYLTSATIEFMGLLILTVQAHVPSLKPPTCALASTQISCQKVNGYKAAMFFTGLYLVALDNKGWQWGFAIATATILTSIPVFLLGSPIYRTKIPAGSPITTMFKVLAAAIYNNCKSKNPSNAVMGMETSPSSYNTETSEGEESNINVKVPSLIEDLKFLNKAIKGKPVSQMLQCTVKQVEEVKVVRRIIPIFMCTIILNCCLAQLSTFFVQQAATMNTKIGSFKVPPASLPVFPVIFMMILAPTYNHVIIPFAKKVTKTEMGITDFQRIGIGLVLSIIAMTVAALVEIRKKR
ncbi:hypothetical protein CRYUN_Cryun07bG0050200 [Craigia yunnanensis]